MAILTVVFSLDSDGDRHRRKRVATIGTAFTSASADLRRHTLGNNILLSGYVARAVMSEIVNDDLRLWVNDLGRFAQQVRPPIIRIYGRFTPGFVFVGSSKTTAVLIQRSNVLLLLLLLPVRPTIMENIFIDYTSI